MAEKKIAGRLFRVDQPLATEALQLQFRVMNMLQGSTDDLRKVFGAMSGAEDAESAKSIGAGESALATIAILSRLKPREGTQFVADVVAMAKIKGENGAFEPADVDTEFSTDPTGLYELVGFVLKTVLGPFISGLAGSMSLAIKAGR
ncbi:MULTISPECIES: phage tail assembly chaperone [unclassified Aureimonas]|uniref:phage tail assembly chaperone n=1 Tax=unclassified Aureimonas TaxID=2615206 RepID=UPI0006F9812E|nr:MULTISPECIES: hypothetical protein [unclassified Aureimonas]KQT52223.1 hypothetical protein ASG62_16325 [Aureimonas sp. Leaf427]KQT70543.1 hypothetical protein ASG54_21625 [Aureimonas sp. Leaf460]